MSYITMSSNICTGDCLLSTCGCRFAVWFPILELQAPEYVTSCLVSESQLQPLHV